VQAGASLCFRNRATLSIPDTRRSELFKSDTVGAETPRSLLYLPMMAQDEIVGVMQLHRDGGVRYFHHEEQASAQHLANQVAASLRLLEQRSIREQLFKSEKLAATGQLIAGVVNDLRNPVESVLTMSQLLLFRGRSEERDLKMLAAEAQRTAEIVARLISFGRNEDAVAAPVELNALLAGLYKFREREWREAGIQLQDRASREAVHVIGAQGQLEQVFLNILLYAERAVAETGSKIITAGTALLGRRVLVDISFPAPEDAADPFLTEDDGGAGGLAVVRGIVQSHGGEVRFEQTNNGTAGRIEIELPRAEMSTRSGSDAVGKRRAAKKLTAVILEPDPVAQRAFVSLLAQRGHRVIPLVSAEEAIDLVQRVKCDLIAATSTSSSRLPGFNWVNFYEKVRPHTDAFVLLTESAEIGHTFQRGEGFVIRKPLHEADLNRVLDEFEAAAVESPAEVS
jgi:signal transduction histidine kinase/CheY-like chemotaxis protein